MKKQLVINSVILVSTLLSFLISIGMPSAGITTVYPHFYYLPILLAAYYYPERGVLFAGFISVLYILPLLFFFSEEAIEIVSAFIRIFMFILVAAIVSHLVLKNESEHLENIELLEFQNKIIENPNVWVVASNIEGKIIIWNRAAENITGHSKAEATGRKDVWEIITPEKEERDRINKLIPGIKSRPGIVERLFIPVKTKSGEIRYLLGSLQSLSGNDGEVSGILGIAVDITKQVELEIENEEVLTQIERNISQMYVLNDEIRNPLTVISLQAEMGDHPSKSVIMDQITCINNIITRLDRDSLESTKILDYLRKHYGFFR